MKLTINSLLMNLNDGEPIRKIVINDAEKEITDRYNEIRDEAEGILFRAKNSVYVFSPECHEILKTIKYLRDENSLVYNSTMDAIDWDKSESIIDKQCAYNCLINLSAIKGHCIKLRDKLNSYFKRDVKKPELQK